MSVSQETRHDDEPLIRYLLGLLSEEETERLDERSVVDEEVVWRLRALEHDLVDAYVRGALDPELIGAFESHYLQSPRRREKVEFARRFVRATDAMAESAVVPPPARPERAAVRWRVWTFAAAAVLLILASAFIVRDRQWRKSVEQAETARVASEQHAQALEQALRQQRQSAADAAAALEQLRAERPASTTTAPAAALFALLLFPQTRGVDPTASGVSLPTLTIAPEATSVRLDLRLEAPDFARYGAVLKEPASGRILWRSERLPAPPAGGQGDHVSIALSIPANVLSARSYVIELSGHDASGAAEIVGSYAFRTVRAPRSSR